MFSIAKAAGERVRIILLTKGEGGRKEGKEGGREREGEREGGGREREEGV